MAITSLLSEISLNEKVRLKKAKRASLSAGLSAVSFAILQKDASLIPNACDSESDGNFLTLNNYRTVNGVQHTSFQVFP